MNCGKHCHSFLRLELEQFHDLKCSVWVQTTCWFIKQDQRRVRYELIADWSAFAFTTRDTSDNIISDLLILARTKTKSLNDALYSILEQAFRQLCPDSGGKQKEFSRSQCSLQNIILLHKRSNFSKITLAQCSSINRDFSVDLRPSFDTCALTQHI